MTDIENIPNLIGIFALAVAGLYFVVHFSRKKKQPQEAPAKEEAAVLPQQPAPEIVPQVSLATALKNTREGFVARIAKALARKSQIDDEIWEELESILFSADVGVRTTQKLIKTIKERTAREGLSDASQIQEILIDEIRQILQKSQNEAIPNEESASPRVILFVGVNGVGKTTTIGKLAQKYIQAGKSVVLGAGDTFRAAAAEQLTVWAERSGVHIVQGASGADPASVLFDAVKYAQKNQQDMVLCDTAGRLHTKQGLMDELKKIHRVLNNAVPGAPHEVYLVLDATTGQNAIMQAKQFMDATPLNGLILSKLDGSAKGGVIIGIVDELGIPVKYIGVGESIADLRPFNANDFVDGLFAKNS